jgi:hypothetical protein
MRLMGGKPKKQNCPVQWDSGMSKLGVGVKNRPAQRHSKMSNGRLSGVLCWPHGRKTKTAPAQRHSGISILGVGVLRILRSLRIMGKKTKSKTTPAQRYSKMSNLDDRPYCPSCPWCPLVFKTTPAQRHSKMSNLDDRPYCPWCPLVFKTSPAQRHSKMSNLKTETENSFPQRHSKMSNGQCVAGYQASPAKRRSVLLC